jgi:hypothetical protein
MIFLAEGVAGAKENSGDIKNNCCNIRRGNILSTFIPTLKVSSLH